MSSAEAAAFAWFQRKVARVAQAAKEAVVETAEDGAGAMRLTIATSGTPKSGKQGRVDTGAMLDSVRVKRDYTLPHAMRVRVGYGDRLKYIPMQDKGFTHWRSGEFIKGTYALSDASVTMRLDLERNLRRHIRGV